MSGVKCSRKIKGSEEKKNLFDLVIKGVLLTLKSGFRMVIESF